MIIDELIELLGQSEDVNRFWRKLDRGEDAMMGVAASARPLFVAARFARDPKATLVWDTMIYQISKMIGEMSAVLCGKVDAILLTGGLMRFDDVAEGIRRRCGFLAPVRVYPGEMEQEALAMPALKVMRGELKPLTYTGKPVWDGFPGISFD